MPTGYTCKVQDGTMTSFEEFAMNCARNFGALVTLRDDMTTPIPEAFEIAPYYEKSLLEANDSLKVALARTDQEWVTEYENSRSSHEEYEKSYASKIHIYRQRYYAMLAHVESWIPPSNEHLGLKKFMVDQLRESIQFDCSVRMSAPISFPPFEQWKYDTLQKLHRDAERAQKSLDDERDRVASRNNWLRQLRESLKAK